MRYLAVLLLLAGCVNPKAVMVSAAGDEVTCQSTGFGIISGTMANNQYQQCVSDAQKHGYRIRETK